MTEIKRIFANTLVLVSAKGVRLLVSLALGVVLARHLGAYHFGNWMAARSLCVLFAIWISLGMDKISIRECAVRLPENRRYLGTVLGLKIALSAISLALVLGLVQIGYRAELAQLIVIALGVYIFSALGESFVITFRSWEKMGYEGLINVFKDLLLMLLVFLAVYFEWGVVRIALLYFGASLIYFIFSWMVVASEFFSPRLRVELPLAGHLLKAGFPLGLAIFFNSYHDINKVIIQKTLGSAETGYYGVAILPYIAWESTVIISLMGALFPLISRLHTSNRENLIKLYRRMSKYLYLVSLPWVMLCLLLPARIMVLLFGDEYLPSAPVFQILGIVTVLMFQNYLFYDAMVAARKEKLFALIMGGSALLNLSLVFLFTPRFGISGGALALGCAQLFSLLAFAAVLRPIYGVFVLNRGWVRPSGAALLSGALMWWEREIGLPLGVIIISGGLFYLLALLVLRCFDSFDRSLFKQLFPLRRESA